MRDELTRELERAARPPRRGDAQAEADLRARVRQRRRRRRWGGAAAGLVAVVAMGVAALAGWEVLDRSAVILGKPEVGEGREPDGAQTDPATWRAAGALPADEVTGDAQLVAGPQAVAAFSGGGEAAVFDPAGRRWRPVQQPPFRATSGHVTVWADETLLVWGGWRDRNELVATRDGAAFDLDDDEWRSVAELPMGARAGSQAVWTGDEAVVVGASPGGHQGAADEAAAYDPDTARWRDLAPAPLDELGGGVQLVALAWTGEGVVLIAAGHDGTLAGFALDPADPHSDWNRLAEPPAVDGLASAGVRGRGVWTGERLLVPTFVPTRGDGEDTGDQLGPVLVYDPAGDRWDQLAPPDGDRVDPHRRLSQHLAWTGEELLMLTRHSDAIGGDPTSGWQPLTLNPRTGQWRELPAPPEGLAPAATAWTDNHLLVLNRDGTATLLHPSP